MLRSKRIERTGRWQKAESKHAKGAEADIRDYSERELKQRVVRVQVTQWFTDKLGYQYDPVVHGNSSEWLSDLISISFTTPPSFFKRSMRSLKVLHGSICQPPNYSSHRDYQ